MGYRFELPHRDTCMGYDAPRPGGATMTYLRDEQNPGTVVIGNKLDAILAGQALGQKPIEEGAIVRLHGDVLAPSYECSGCARENWLWVDLCPLCGTPRDSDAAA